MPLSPAQAQVAIFNEVGGNITFGNRPEHEIALDVSIYWLKNDMFVASPMVQYYSTKLDCIDFLLGQLRYLTSQGIGDLNPQLGTRYSNLEYLQKMTADTLEMWKVYYAQQRPSVIVQNPNVAPIEKDRPWGPNPNSRRLRGDALRPPLFSE